MNPPSVMVVDSWREFWRQIESSRRETRRLYRETATYYELYAVDSKSVLVCKIMKPTLGSSKADEIEYTEFVSKFKRTAALVVTPPTNAFGEKRQQDRQQRAVPDALPQRNVSVVSKHRVALSKDDSIRETPSYSGRPFMADEQKPAEAGQKKEAVQDAERFINALFRGLSGQMAEDMLALETRIMDAVNAKFAELQRLLGFSDIQISEQPTQAPTSTPAQPQTPAPAPAQAKVAVTLKSKIEEIVRKEAQALTERMDTEKKAMTEEIGRVKSSLDSAKTLVEQLESRLRGAKVDFSFPQAQPPQPPKA